MTEVTVTQELEKLWMTVRDYPDGYTPREWFLKNVADHVTCAELAAIEAAKEACADVADERAKHIEILMLSDEKGVTDSRVAFQMACQLVAKDIRALTATDIMKGVGR